MKFLPRLLSWLLSWLPSWPRRPGGGEQRLDVYMPSERLIFQYYDGTDTVRAADPMTLHGRFMDVRAELVTDLKVAESEHRDARKCRAAATRTMHAIFGTKPFEEGGLTQLEVESLMDQFLDYCASIKKNSSGPPTSPEGTSPPSPSGSGASPPTASASDSGSTASAPPTAPSPSSTPGSATPSA